MKNTFLILLNITCISLFAQNLSGKIYGTDEKGNKTPLQGAAVYWLNTQAGAFTDSLGHFELPKVAESQRLVASFGGYKEDTVDIKNADNEIVINLPSLEMGVVIKGKQNSVIISSMTPQLTETITTKELYKAACCNLSESFQTNASVDVSFNDAVSGAKQIRMLGLSGIYSQIITENVPTMRGLATAYGLSYIPGPWMDKIDIAKGSASVLNGYEGITGQINVEYKKPQTSPRLFINVYGNQMSRMESSINYASAVNKKKTLTTMLMAHGNYTGLPMDMNGDSFTDEHLQKQVSVHNRWAYFGENGLEFQLSGKYLYEKRNAGQIAMNHGGHDMGGMTPYLVDIETSRSEIVYKNGYVFAKKPYRSIGFVLSGVHHQQKSAFGNRNYRGTEKFAYSKLIFQDIIGNTNHTYRLGLSYLYDDYAEAFQSKSYTRRENVPGVFGEYTYTYLERFSAVLGFRADKHNLYGNIYTPRVHLRYKPTEKATIRVSAGNSTRVANIFADNPGVWASSRELIIKEKLLPEKAWNYGISYLQNFSLFARDARFMLDFFRTDFQNQVIMDREDASKIVFYNLKGKSYSNAFQSEVNFEPLEKFEVKMAYKFTDVKTQYEKGFLASPFVARHRGYLNLNYTTNMDRWKFDVTMQYVGKSRIPDLSQNPEATSWKTESPAFVQLFAQITRTYLDWDFYIGGENLTNYRQMNPIINAENPFGGNFDAAMVWGPIFGRMIYGGLRWKLDKKI
ncbi:MAG: TonB-dependent receptor domain-containing protein [Bacteroidia bacterium]